MNTPLPPQGPPGPDDELPDEAGLAALYRKLPQNEPSPALDAAVLHAAAQAIAGPDITQLPQGERRKTPREPGDWVRPKLVSDDVSFKPSPSVAASRTPRHRSLVALASAASLVLVAGLAWHMREMPSQLAAPAAVRAAFESSTAASAPAAAPAMPQASAAKPAPNGLVSQNHAASAAVGVVVSDSAKPVAAATPAESIAYNAEVAPKRMSPTVADIPTDGVPAASAKAMASPAMKDQAMDKAADSTARVAHRQSVSSSPAPPPVAELSAARPMPEPVAAQAAPAPPPSPAPPPAVEEVSEAPVMPAPATAAPALPSPPHIIAVAPSAGLPDASANQDIVSPEARELDAIRKLFAEHHDDEGQQRLQNFHRLHPQWPLPADLQAKLRKP